MHLSLCLAVLTASLLHSADTSAVLQFPVPDALTLNNGQPVTDAATWTSRRRPEILEAFAEHVYGRTPSKKLEAGVQISSVDRNALNGTAIRKEIVLTFHNNERAHSIHLLLYLPANGKGPVPVIVGLNFSGNQTVDADPGISLPYLWQPDPADPEPIRERRRHIQILAKADSRGASAHLWEVAKLLSHGFGLATVWYGDIEPDFDGAIGLGVRNLFLPEGKTSVGSNEWGAIGAWAWGLSRIADYLVTDHDVDATRLGIMGFSRLGKASLWAAAQDQRFALVISNESGMGGASLYRAKTGETIEHLNTAFPHWFCANFHQYTGHPDQVPGDGNLLLSLIAPRPLYVASAAQDASSNPQAEFLSASLVGQVYKLFGKEGLGDVPMPPLNQPVTGTVAYHDRSGAHDVTEFDWDQYLKFAGLYLGR